MKIIWILSFTALITINSYAQQLGGIQLQDYLSSSIHPECTQATNKYVIDLPNDSIWVNLEPGSAIKGFFNYSWVNGIGDDLLIETGYHQSLYDVRLILLDSSYSLSYNVVADDWMFLTDTVLWNHAYSISGDCQEYTTVTASQWVARLDFEQDFGIQPSDIVIGVEVNFLQTPGFADLAGIYITEFAMPCNQVDLEEDVTICLDETILINAGDFDFYQWNDQSSDSTLYIDGALVGQGVHTYSVEVIDANGCYSKDTINIAVEICSNINKVNEKSKILVYPNPVNDFLNISFQNKNNNSEIRIFNYNGKLIDQLSSSKNTIIIDVSDYPKGMYLGKIEDLYFRFMK